MIVLLSVLFILAYFYLTRNNNYWAERNVKHDRPIPIFGNHFRTVFGFKSLVEQSVDQYTKYPTEKVIGYFRGSTPELIVRDPDLIRRILSVDFSHFYLRGMGRNPNVDALMYSLFHIDGDKWRLLRQRLTPAFTTNKLKNMFPLVVKCAEKLQVVVGEHADRGTDCDVRELMARFTTEFIGACGFGIEMDSINDEHSQFRALGKQLLSPNLITKVLLAIAELFPEISNNLRKTRKESERSMTEILLRIREQRNFRPIGRNDFIDLLLELEQKGRIIGDSIEKKNSDGSPLRVEMEMDIASMTGQLFVFFVAGFETSSSATSFTLHQLALNPDVQRKVQREIDQVLLKYENKLCFDSIAEMKYLDMAFMEAMRLFPSLGCLHRVCAQKYHIPELNISIDPGVKVMIPVQAIQNDEKYFDSPKEFRPERFLPNAINERHKYVYLPFGEGPRNCIGARLGLMQSLAGLAAVLHRYSVEPSPTTSATLTIDKFMNVVQGVVGGIPLLIRRRDDQAAA